MQKINMATNQKVDRHPNLSVRYPPIIGLKALLVMMLGCNWSYTYPIAGPAIGPIT